MTEARYFHGGVDGLKPGDLLIPGQGRKHHDGCPWCEARAKGEAHLGMDPLAQREAVYFTTDKLYAKHYASLYGAGDLYRVEPVGEALPSEEDSYETYTAPTVRVVGVVERAVRLTHKERRRLARDWEAADRAKARIRKGTP